MGSSKNGEKGIMSIFKKKQQTNRNQEPLKTQARFVYENKTALRFFANLAILALSCCAVMLSVTFRDNLIGKKIQTAANYFYQYSTFHGFSIDDIVVEGRKKTSLDLIAQKINLNRNDSILKTNLATLKADLETLPWVEKAQITRSYFPNVLHILIEEKNIIALFQKGGQFFPVDENGNVLYVDFKPNKPYLILVGDDAPKKFFELKKITSTVPELESRIKAAVLHSSERWDLIFDDLDKGILIKLPEENLDRAFKKLVVLNNKYGIFKRKLTFIDLRYKDKVTVNIAD